LPPTTAWLCSPRWSSLISSGALECAWRTGSICGWELPAFCQ
jgi:hypothetical protein